MGIKLTLLTAFFACLFLMSFRGDKKKKVVFFGDSITQAGVQKGGYIDVLQNMIAANGAADKFELNGAGIGGNKIDRKSTRLNFSHVSESRMPSSA